MSNWVACEEGYVDSTARELIWDRVMLGPRWGDLGEYGPGEVSIPMRPGGTSLEDRVSNVRYGFNPIAQLLAWRVLSNLDDSTVNVALIALVQYQDTIGGNAWSLIALGGTPVEVRGKNKVLWQFLSEMGQPLRRFDHPPDSLEVADYLQDLKFSRHLNHSFFNTDNSRYFVWGDVRYQLVEGEVCESAWLALLGYPPMIEYSIP